MPYLAERSIATPATATDPDDGARICEHCGGQGTVEQFSYAIGWHDARCEGIDDDGTCDDGTVWA